MQLCQVSLYIVRGVTLWDEKELSQNNILNQMLKCNVECSGDFHIRNDWNVEDAIDHLLYHLPDVKFIIDQTVNFIFSDGFRVKGSDADNDRFDNWLFQKNINGQTNISVLKECTWQTLAYGKSGLRWLSLEDGIINVNSRNYASVLVEDTEYYGFDRVIGYILAMENFKVYDVDMNKVSFDEEEFMRTGVVIDKNNKLLYLDDEHLLNVRMNTSKTNGEAPLTFDRERVKLLLSVLKRMNYDVEYDGAGRLILRLKNGATDTTGNGMSAGKLIKSTTDSEKEQQSIIQKESEGIAKGLKEAGSDSVIVLSSIFSDKVEHLPRVTKAEDFQWLIDEAGVIMARIFGMDPILFNLGNISGNVSMKEIKDNAMLNVVIPLREMFAQQYSSLLSKHLNVKYIYFNKYEMKQVTDQIAEWKDMSEIIYRLEMADSPASKALMEEILSSDLYNENGSLKKLGMISKVRHKVKVMQTKRRLKKDGRLKEDFERSGRHESAVS